MNPAFKVTAIGNAIVDILAPATTDFILNEAANGMARNGMSLIDMKRADALFKQMNNPVIMSGGSAANSMACFAALGGRGAYIGKVAMDRFGDDFASDMNKTGIYFKTAPLQEGPPTAQCLIFVEDDGQRSMNTYLGASVLLTPDDIDETIISQSDIVYLEGYLFDRDEAKKAFLKAAEFVKKHNKKLSLTLSDSFCVERHRDDFMALIKNHVDILFANEHELLSLYQTTNLSDGIERVQSDCALTAVTKGEAGSVIVLRDDIIDIKAHPAPRIIDSTGAGDAYAAGFLYGLTHGYSHAQAGNLGSRIAAEIIGQMGPRPQQNFEHFLVHAA